MLVSKTSIERCKKNKGSVLVVVLVFATISLTLVRLLMDQFLIKEREILNFRDNQQALQLAELTLSEAKQKLKVIVSGAFNNTAGLYEAGNGEQWYSTVSFDTPADVMTYSGRDLPNITNPPTFIVEKLRATFDVTDGLEVSTPVRARHFRVTTQASSSTGAKVKVQTVYEYD